jgi:hypothetical protein
MSHRELLRPIRRVEWDDETWVRTLERFEARRSQQTRFRTRQADARASGYKSIRAWEAAGQVLRPVKPAPAPTTNRLVVPTVTRLLDLSIRGYFQTREGAWRYVPRSR